MVIRRSLFFLKISMGQDQHDERVGHAIRGGRQQVSALTSRDGPKLRQRPRWRPMGRRGGMFGDQAAAISSTVPGPRGSAWRPGRGCQAPSGNKEATRAKKPGKERAWKSREEHAMDGDQHDVDEEHHTALSNGRVEIRPLRHRVHALTDHTPSARPVGACQPFGRERIPGLQSLAGMV